MKFFRPRTMDAGTNPAVLWDKDANKAAFEFVNGELETDDPELIEKLQAMGYYYLDPERQQIITRAEALASDLREEYDAKQEAEKTASAGEEKEPEVPATAKPIKRKPKRKPASKK